MTAYDPNTRERPLNDVMEFDHVIRVHADGAITDTRGIYAPDLRDDVLDSDHWELLDGYSGQDRYAGPIMHPSEFIGGGMERDIRETPGVYVALIAYYSPEEDDDPDDYDDAGGWAVARLKDEFDPDHEHQFGPVERSHLAGTLHRKCYVAGCRFISLDLDDDE